MSVTPRAILEARLSMEPQLIEMLYMVWNGWSHDRIAEELAIPQGTVKSRCHRLYKKIGARGQVSAALFAERVIMASGWSPGWYRYDQKERAGVYWRAVDLGVAVAHGE